MKKIRYGCLTLLCVLMMVSISACGGRDNGTGTTSSPSQSAATASEASESTGVIDGLLDDVGNEIEDGVKDVESAVEGSETSTAETSAAR